MNALRRVARTQSLWFGRHSEAGYRPTLEELVEREREQRQAQQQELVADSTPLLLSPPSPQPEQQEAAGPSADREAEARRAAHTHAQEGRKAGEGWAATEHKQKVM